MVVAAKKQGKQEKEILREEKGKVRLLSMARAEKETIRMLYIVINAWLQGAYIVFLFANS